jgi:hypothetical protein
LAGITGLDLNEQEQECPACGTWLMGGATLARHVERVHLGQNILGVDEWGVPVE